MNISAIKSLLVAGIIGLSTASASATVWNFTGSGTTSLTESGNSITATYNNSGKWGVWSGNWTLSGIAETAGKYVFDYDYSGVHSWYQSEAKLFSFTGTPAQSTNLFWGGAEFSKKGTVDFGYLNKGDHFGFTMTGKHFDRSLLMQGNLKLTNVAPVPEPETYALMGMGLVGLLAARRRKSKQA